MQTALGSCLQVGNSHTVFVKVAEDKMITPHFLLYDFHLFNISKFLLSFLIWFMMLNFMVRELLDP